MFFTLLPIVTEVRPRQFWKAYSPMLVTLLGIVTEVRPIHSLKAPFPMLVTQPGIVTDVKVLPPEKVQFPMFVTLPGIDTLCIPPCPLKEQLFICFVPDGMIKSTIFTPFVHKQAFPLQSGVDDPVPNPINR